MNPLFWNVLADGFLSSFMIPLRSQTAFFAMQAFGQDMNTMRIAAVIAVIGAVLGHMLNFGLGMFLLRYKTHFWGDAYDKTRPYFVRYGVFTLLGSFITLFGIFSFAAGLFAVRPRYAIALLFIGQAAFYAQYVV